MSIWEKCEEHKAMPFYGFPVKPSFEDGLVKFEFPEGYAPNGSKTQEVAEKIKRLFNGEIIVVTDNIVKVKIDQEVLGYVIYRHFMDSK